MKKYLVLIMLFASAVVYAEGSFNYGINLRLRQEYWGDVSDLNSNAGRNPNFFRIKTSGWAKYDVNNNFDAYLRITNESRYYLTNALASKDNTWDGNEVLVDNLYIDVRNVCRLPLDIRAGRQDFLGKDAYGEGFLLMDGTPGDGSRSYYFNALKSTYRFNDKNSLDLVFINSQKQDNALPLIDSKLTAINSCDGFGVLLYNRNTINEKVSIEEYFLNSTEKLNPDLNLNTVGARAVYKPGAWKFRGELALQSGEYTNSVSRIGIGGYAFATRSFKDTNFTPEAEFGAVYLSGDDVTTKDKVESWDPVYSRWPWLSELIVYTYASEPGAGQAYWTNLSCARISGKMFFTKQSYLSLIYNMLSANQKTPAAGIFSGKGTNRGQLPQVKYGYKFSERVDSYVLYEYFIPGDFYTASCNAASFFRWNVDLKF